MTTNSNSVSMLQSLKQSATYKDSSVSNGRYTVTVDVDGVLHYGHGFSIENARNDAAANAILYLNNNDKKPQYKNAFYVLKEKRKGLVFQSIGKDNGLFDVSVQVDYVKYFGKGATQKVANNDCAANVLAAFDSGDHLKNTQQLYESAFTKLKEMYSNLLYQTLGQSDDKYEVYVNVDGIDYFGEGTTILKANNDTAWNVLKSIWKGAHKKKLQEIEEYWYDDDYYDDCSSNYSSDSSTHECRYCYVPVCQICHSMPFSSFYEQI